MVIETSIITYDYISFSFPNNRLTNIFIIFACSRND